MIFNKEKEGRTVRKSVSKWGTHCTFFYTMGSPIALWSISYDEFDHPIEVPARRMKELPIEVIGLIFNGQDDIISYPLGLLEVNSLVISR